MGLGLLGLIMLCGIVLLGVRLVECCCPTETMKKRAELKELPRSQLVTRALEAGVEQSAIDAMDDHADLMADMNMYAHFNGNYAATLKQNSLVETIIYQEAYNEKNAESEEEVSEEAED
eukprot:CAMPEP_0169284762 /NCGR_PEP_ID=MMETSP1016-20121227/58295_1 /TAXON_ID=342587 /ORGANISM="Karlodinium micrum, Strain CCMP2283" /LENGTH=118 /DNA_ID=CAMNT_0009374139 /DNA_START=37 /DNA_END=393 /DNA_ORIENTATION=+